MSIPPRSLARAVGLALLVASVSSSACRDRRSEPAQMDSALARDLTLPAPGPARPTLGDSALPAAGSRASTSRPAPAGRPREETLGAGRPAPTTRRPEPKIPVTPTIPNTAPQKPPTASTPHANRSPAEPATLAAGTVLTLRPHIRVCTNANAVGDVFEATVAQAVASSDGISLPAGSNAVLKVTGIREGTGGAHAAVLDFAVLAVGVTQRSYVVSLDGNTSPGVASRAPMAQEVADFGSCVERGEEMRLTLANTLRLTDR